MAPDNALDWIALEEGRGRVTRQGDRLHLELPPTPDRPYANAEIADRFGARRWQAPLRLTIRARFSSAARLHGTAGFGFWNTALSPGMRGVRPPRAVWYFFASPQSNLPLALGVPGHGFKAMVIDANRLPFFLLLPFALYGCLLMRVPALYRRLWPIAQRAIGVSEALLAEIDLTDWHTYAFDWEADRVTFRVDEQVVHVTPCAPAGPLGFVAWIDNAYAVATPWGQLAMGTIAISETEWLELEGLTIEKLGGESHAESSDQAAPQGGTPGRRAERPPR